MALDNSVKKAVETRIRNSRDSRTCPLLSTTGPGECQAYDARPSACRTYGFYTDREGGLYCDGIAKRVEAGDLDDVVWGNQEAVEATLDEFGERRTVQDWFYNTVLRQDGY